MAAARITWLAVALATLLGTGNAFAQTGTVKGTVQDHAGVALSGAEVRIEGTTLHTSSDEAGKYELANVPPGAQKVRALMMGYKSDAKSVTVEAGAVVTADFHLEHSVIPVQAIEVVIGSRAKHTAADELAVPVDVYGRDVLLRQGTTETAQMLQALSPSVNFPRQSVTDATDVVRPFTLRGLSPDQTLVLVNGMRRHQTALVNTFAYGMPAGSSGVDMNAIPSSAIDRVEVLRDGAAAQYGSDAIAGVVNVVMRRGRYAPFATVTGGSFFTKDYDRDGENFNVNAGWGVGVGKGSLSMSAEALDREATNRAWADPFENGGVPGNEDVVGPDGKVIQKNNLVPQPNHHWGDGFEKDILSLVSLNYPLSDHSQVYAFGGYSHRLGNGNGYRRYSDSARNWSQIYPLGYLPEFRPEVTDYSMAGGWKGELNGWNTDAGATFGHSGFRYELHNTLNVSLGPSLTVATSPAGIPNQTDFFAGELHRDEFVADVNTSKEMKFGLPAPVNVALGAAYRRERWVTLAGELASWVDGGVLDRDGNDAPGGSQVFPGFSPNDVSDSRRDNIAAYMDLESNLTTSLLANAAARFENYNDFGSLVTGKLAARWQPDKHVTVRAAGSTGFRAPGLSQVHFSKVITNVIGGQPVDIGVFPVGHPAARALGAKELKEEKSVNLSAGVAVTPVDNLTLTVDVYQIKITDRILLGATFDDSTSTRILGNAGYGNVAGVQYFTNGLDTKTTGLDLTADWRVPMGDKRMITFNAAANYGKNEITHVDGLPSVLATSTGETGLLDEVTTVAITKERPDWRGTLTTEYTQGPARGLLRASYYGTFSSAQPAFTDGYTEKYPARTLVDVEAGYKLGPLDWAIGSRNVLDTYPGKAKLDFNNNFGVFPWAAASPFGYNGRFVYTRATWTLPR